MEINTDIIHQNQIDLLQHSQKLLSECSISESGDPLHFSVSELNTENRKDLQDKIKDFGSGIQHDLIYTVSLDDSHTVNDIQAAIKSYKKQKKHALSKVNPVTSEWRESGRVLYVGTSKAVNFATRIKNHLGVGSKGVYSLHLIHWLPSVLQSGITIRTYIIDGPQHQHSNINLLELIEQGFWDKLKPMFGKRSGLL